MGFKHFGPPRLEADSRGLVLAFEFNREWLPELRKFARWDGVVWRAPIDNLSATLEFCRARGFKIAREVLFLETAPEFQGVEGVTVDGRWIHLRFAYERVRAEQAKRITGCTFDEKLACWTAPTSALDEVIEFAANHRLPVSPELVNQAATVKKRRESLYRGSNLLTYPEHPEMHPSLDPHQRVAVAYVNVTRRCFLAEDVGVGKSFEALASLDFCNGENSPSYPSLIICPPKLTVNWEKEIRQWYPSRTVQILKTKKDAPEPGFDFTVVGWSILHALEPKLVGFNSLVADESHSAKNRSAQRTRAFVKVAKRIPGVRLALTGTPMSVRIEDFKPQLEALGMLESFGGAAGFDRSFVKEDRPEVLNRWLRSTGYIRRLREDVLDLPPVRHGDLMVEGNLTNYRRAERDVLQYVAEQAGLIAEELGEDPHSAAVRARLRAQAGKHLVELSILRKEAGLAKVPAALEWIESSVESGKTLIVAAHHREVVDALAEPYGLKIQGGQSATEVERVKAEFQAGAPVIVVSIQAGKEGHTLTAASDCVFVEFPWTSTDYDQTWGRGWRKGQTKPFYVTALLCAGTQDETQFDALGRRRYYVGKATEGDSGTAMLMSLFSRI